MTTKITKRVVLDALIAAANAGDINLDTYEVSVEDVRNYAENEIALLDKRAVKAKERAAVKKAEGDDLLEVVFEALGEDFEPIADICSRIEGEDVTVGKVGARLRKLVEAGRAERTELKVKPADGGKTRTLVGYRKI